MAAPKKVVSDTMMQSIAGALDTISNDPTLARTKREIERLTGLSHASVARAFAQDAASSSNHWRLTVRFDVLVKQTGQRSPEDARISELTKEVKEKNKRIQELESQVDEYAQALYAYHLASSSQPDEEDYGIVEKVKNSKKPLLKIIPT